MILSVINLKYRNSSIKFERISRAKNITYNERFKNIDFDKFLIIFSKK